MRSSIFYLLVPLLVRAGDLKIVGMGERGGEAVQAGQDITLTISSATEAGVGYVDTKVTHFRLYLRNSIYTMNMCSLTGLLPAEDGNITVTIPPEMGPSGMYYTISYDGYNNPTNTSWTQTISLGYDTPFFYLTGGKGSWIPAETTPILRYYGLMGFSFADIPCKSYPCAQQCAAKFFPRTSSWEEGSDWTRCLTACAGVIINTDNRERKPVDWNVAVNSTLAVPSQPCKEANFETTCGDQCCSGTEYCSEYKSCVDLPTPTPRSFPPSTSTVSQTRTSTDTTAQATGASNAILLRWDLYGAAVGAVVFGIVGPGI